MQSKFLDLLNKKKFLVFDGAMGTMLLNYGFKGGCAEKLNLENPTLISKIHQEYALAGADVIETNTFGASAVKLAEYNLQDKVEEINIAAVKIARRVCSKNKLVAGDIGPLGKLMEPIGQVSFDEAYKVFAEQAKALEKGGADLLIIETISDIQEMRAALIAAKNETQLPVLCSLTYAENGKTITGTDFLTAAITCEALGADAICTNCGNGPEQLYQMLKPLKKEIQKIQVPLMIMPNAGLPEIEEGSAVYRMEPKAFASNVAKINELGFEMFGGCCGTTPAHIKQLKIFLTKSFQNPKKIRKDKHTLIFTSRQKQLELTKKSPLLVVGERLNPTARKAFAAELKEGKTQFLKEESLKQKDEGAHLLDLNVGTPEIDQIAMMKKMLNILSTSCDLPLCIDSDDSKVIEEALKNYPGIALVNSVNGKENSLKEVLPIVKKYGAAVIALALDEKGIPKTAQARMKIIKKIVKKCDLLEIAKNKIFADTLVMAVATEAGAPVVTLETIKLCKKEGLKTSLGVSNVSFGLPQRKIINNAFLTLAVKAGLSAGIVNPASLKIYKTENQEFKLAKDVLLGKDKGARNYIKKMSKEPRKEKAGQSKKQKKNILDLLYQAVVDGAENEIVGFVENALKDNSPQKILDVLITGIEKVGELYEQGDYFLPQMVMSANTMKKAFIRAKQNIPADSIKSKGTAIICTVKGDIHDIGKNIVAMLLENHGFRVIDLGKDIPVKTIIEVAIREKADLVLLSALLTTTMLEMKTVKKELEKNNVKAKVMVGGAVVTDGFASKINASYAKDALGAVKLAKELING